MPGEGLIVVACACGKKLKAPAGSAGKKARFPARGAALVVGSSAPGRTAAGAAINRSSTVAAKPAVAMAAAPRPVRSRPTAGPAAVPPASASAAEDDLDALYELAEQAKAAPAAGSAAQCPQCMADLDDGAVLCTNCGFDTRTGRVISTAPLAKPARTPAAALASKGKQPVDLMAPQGSFLAGVAMSAAFALAASVVWFIVAWATGYAVGYIAMLIGAAAGVGMRIGHKGFSSAGGTTAAAMTLAAILAVKVAVLEAVLQRHHANASIFNLNQAKLAYYFFNPIGLIIIVIGMAAAYRTANGSMKG